MSDNAWNDNVPGPVDAKSAVPHQGRTWALRVLGILALIAIIWLAWSGYRAARSGMAARRDLAALQGLAASPSLESLPALRENMAGLDTHLSELQRASRPFLWLAPYLGWLPRYGADIQNAPALLGMVLALAAGGHQALETLGPEMSTDRGQGDMLARAVRVLTQAGPALEQAENRLAEAERWRSQISGPLSPGVVRLVDRADQVLPVASAGLRLAQMAPELLGANGPRSYLILAQNSHELRATGGFISSVGLLRLDQGRITDLRVSDSYAVDNLDQPHPDAPRVLAEQMGSQILLLRDSNWSPDFPMSAQIARTIYEQDQGVATDGAIAIDLEAVRLLVGAVEPLEVPGLPGPVTGANALDLMKQAWAQPATSQGATAKEGTNEWFLRRKDFAGPLMMAALARAQSGDNLHPAALASSLVNMLEGRHLQLAVDQTGPAAVLREQGWDGALRLPENSDFVAVVDSNLGFNKTNAAVKQAIDYRVDQDGNALLARLTLTYTHTAPFLSGACDRAVRLGNGSYDDMINRCHWNYLRAYIPGGAELVNAEGLEGAGSEQGEDGSTVIAGSFTLRPAESHVVKLVYRLPSKLVAEPYQLLVRKQAGTDAPPLRVQAGSCLWQSDLARDRLFRCAEWKRGD